MFDGSNPSADYHINREGIKMKYIVVKYARLTGFAFANRSESYTLTDSCHDTYSGVTCGIKPVYNNFDEAQVACNAINESNPCGHYGVVEISD